VVEAVKGTENGKTMDSVWESLLKAHITAQQGIVCGRGC